MGRQYKYVFACGIDHYGFLSHHTGKCIDSMVEEGVEAQDIRGSGYQDIRI